MSSAGHFFCPYIMESRDIFLIVTLFIVVTVIAHIFASGCPPEEAPFVGGGEAGRGEAGHSEAGHSESNDITRYFVDAG